MSITFCKNWSGNFGRLEFWIFAGCVLYCIRLLIFFYYVGSHTFLICEHYQLFYNSSFWQIKKLARFLCVLWISSLKKVALQKADKVLMTISILGVHHVSKQRKHWNTEKNAFGKWRNQPADQSNKKGIFRPNQMEDVEGCRRCWQKNWLMPCNVLGQNKWPQTTQFLHSPDCFPLFRILKTEESNERKFTEEFYWDVDEIK